MDLWRQTGIIDPSILGDAKVTLIGAGGIGSPTGINMGKMGIGTLLVYDGDKIEPHNMPNQMYMLEDNGKNKAVALQENIGRYSDMTKVIPKSEMYDGQPLQGVVISAVDDMDVRKMIFTHVKQQKPVGYVEARMGAEFMRIYTLNPNEDCSWYDSQLYTNEEAMDLPCTATAIMYNVFVMGGLISSQVKKILTNGECHREIIFDLVTMTLMCSDEMVQFS